MGYPNLKAEMRRHGIGNKDIADNLHIAVSTVSVWLNGADSAFPILKAKEVRNRFFPNLSLDYLFSESPIDQAGDDA